LILKFSYIYRREFSGCTKAEAAVTGKRGGRGNLNQRVRISIYGQKK